MNILLNHSIADAPALVKLRRGKARGLALGLALGRAGCGHEAALLLRPIKKSWQHEPVAREINAWLEAQTWWNAQWQVFAAAVNRQRIAQAERLLGGRARYRWDFPPLLMHVGNLAAARGERRLAMHIFRRVLYLVDRGVPKLPGLASFEYGALARLLELQADAGDVAGARRAYATMRHNPGNEVGYRMLGAYLLAKSGQLKPALARIADVMRPGKAKRNGWGKTYRESWLAKLAAIAPLRNHPDWKPMLKNPVAYLEQSRTAPTTR